MEPNSQPEISAVDDQSSQKKLSRKLLFFALAAIIIIADQLSKNWIVRHFEVGESLPLIENILHFTYVRNPGAAFGLFTAGAPFFIALSIGMILLVIFAEHNYFGGHILTRLSMAFILGGTAGNCIDRLRYGYVVDFMDIQVWPVFNVADSALVLGAFLLLYGSYKAGFFALKN